MAIYLVNQGKTYKDEREGGYLWSPKRDAGGKNNAGYTLMTSVKRGDFILHNSGGKISSISIAVKDCYEAMQSFITARPSTHGAMMGIVSILSIMTSMFRSSIQTSPHGLSSIRPKEAVSTLKES